jgi:hypothetical protein
MRSNEHFGRKAYANFDDFSKYGLCEGYSSSEYGSAARRFHFALFQSRKSPALTDRGSRGRGSGLRHLSFVIMVSALALACATLKNLQVAQERVPLGIEILKRQERGDVGLDFRGGLVTGGDCVATHVNPLTRLDLMIQFSELLLELVEIHLSQGRLDQLISRIILWILSKFVGPVPYIRVRPPRFNLLMVHGVASAEK